MKKLVAFLLCLALVMPVFAKNDKDRNEFSITYGQYTIPQFAYVMGGVLGRRLRPDISRSRIRI